MIQATVRPYGVRVSGHAGYGPEGQDIVCAAVSALVYALAAQLDNDGILDVCQLEEGDAILYTSDTERARPYLDMVRSGFKLLEESYGNFLKFYGEGE